MALVEALATAVLDSLTARGGAVACTTHYEGLKLLALTNDQFRNASVGFDFDTVNDYSYFIQNLQGKTVPFSFKLD